MAGTSHVGGGLQWASTPASCGELASTFGDEVAGDVEDDEHATANPAENKLKNAIAKPRIAKA
jgi:hypothetical protein